MSRCVSRVGGYREFTPPTHLSHVVEGRWFHSPPSYGLSAIRTHRVLPHFSASLCVERSRKPDGRLGRSRLTFIGPVRNPLTFVTSLPRDLVALRLRPELVGALLEVDPTEHWDAWVDYDELAPHLARPLAAALEGVERFADTFRLLEGWLANRLGKVAMNRSTALTATREIVEHLRRDDGSQRIGALTRDTGWSAPYLRRLFRSHLGIGPKRLGVFFRLNAAVRLADASAQPGWADIAARLGYSDQAHLANDYRRWTGRSPGELHRERLAEPGELARSGAATAPPRGALGQRSDRQSSLP